MNPQQPPQQPNNQGQAPNAPAGYQYPANTQQPQPAPSAPLPQQQQPLPPQPQPQVNPAPAQQQYPQPGQQVNPGYQQPPAPQAAPKGKHKTQAAPKTNPNSTQNSLLVSEIRDGIAIMNDGSFRSVIMTKSINFDLMSPQEREGVEYSYQSFLNSLYFDIQIFVRSTKVDIRPYIERLDKLRTEQDNMLLALMMEDYIQFIDILAQETNIMDKQFYVIIPYYLESSVHRTGGEGGRLLSGILKKPNTGVQTINEADLEKAKQEMRNRVQSVMAGLQQVGVQAIPLDTEELIELYYDSYNPDTATRQRIRNFQDLNAPIITKGDGNAMQPHLDREVQ